MSQDATQRNPLASLFELDSKLQQPVTPVGFIVLLLLVVMVIFYGLFKQSIFFVNHRMQELERRLNLQCNNDQPLFHLVEYFPLGVDPVPRIRLCGDQISLMPNTSVNQ